MIIEELTHVKLVAALGLTYAAVPLYRAFCAATGYSGTPMTDSSRYSEPVSYTHLTLPTSDLV